MTEGWDCTDVGAGAGSITEWLCRRVGSTGHVLATDIDTRFPDALQYPNLDVRHHDITRQALPAAAFDLVHTRALLVHLADCDIALEHMVQALKPGGWLLVEEPDFVSAVPDPRCPTEAMGAVEAAVRQFITAAGFDWNYSRRLFGDVRAAGLVDVEADGRFAMKPVGSPHYQIDLVTFVQLRDRLIHAGLLTDEQADAFVDAYNCRTLWQ